MGIYSSKRRFLRMARRDGSGRCRPPCAFDVFLRAVTQVDWQAWALDDEGAPPNGPQLPCFLLDLPAEWVVGVSAACECAVDDDLGVVVNTHLLVAMSRVEGLSLRT